MANMKLEQHGEQIAVTLVALREGDTIMVQLDKPTDDGFKAVVAVVSDPVLGRGYFKVSVVPTGRGLLIRLDQVVAVMVPVHSIQVS